MPIQSIFHRHRSPTAVRVVHLTEFDHATSFFPNWQGRFEQLSPGRFAGTLSVVRGEIVRVVQIDSNQRVFLRGRDAGGLCSIYPVIAGNATSVWHGRRLTPGQLVVHGTEAETNHITGRRTEDLGLSLTPESLDEATRLLLGTDDAESFPTWAVLSPPPAKFARLNQKLNRLMKMGVADPTVLGTAEGRGLEQECIRSLVASLGEDAVPQSRLTLRRRAQLISRAEEFMRSRFSDPFGAIELCRELGASDRTLRLAFLERYGIGPMVYYRCLRLNAVRSRLLANPLTNVADAARKCGFHHLGNFAADYRRLFGMRPSAARK